MYPVPTHLCRCTYDHPNSTALLALPLVFALTINPLTGATTGGTVTITWSATNTDPPYFSIELVNPAFHNTFAIANNVQTSLGELTIQLPQVPIECVPFLVTCIFPPWLPCLMLMH